jgi:hypothetical protein
VVDTTADIETEVAETEVAETETEAIETEVADEAVEENEDVKSATDADEEGAK